MLTLSQVKASRIPVVLNVCPDSSDLLSYVNEAQQRLLSYPDSWVGTWQLSRWDITDGFVVFPRGVLNIRNAKVCNTPMNLRNEFYEYLSPIGEPGDSEVTGNFLTMAADGTTPVFQNITTDGNRVRAYLGTASDAGKRILIQGYDQNGVWVRTQDATDITGETWVDGEWLTLASPFVDSVTRWKAGMLTGVQREATNQNTDLFEANYDTQTEAQLASYQPDELVPSYRKSRILHFKPIANTYKGVNCTCRFQMDAVVKLGHIPVYQDTDYFVIQNMAALKDAAMSVKLEEDAGPGAGAASMASAINLLRKELQNYNGQKVHIRPDLQGGRTFRNMVVRGMR